MTEVSVVVPVFNEESNVVPLVQEIVAALDGRVDFEIVFVDDGSSDGTLARLREAQADIARLRVLAHGENCGQSAALRSGIGAASGQLIVTLDGDGQNDPGDIPAVLERFRSVATDGRIGMVSGRRMKRKDTWSKRMASQIGNSVRRFILRDGAADTGCALKAFRREDFLRLPYFDHMHRYLAALMLREGLAVDFVDVRHRPRRHGTSKYGVLDRALVSVADLFGVWWLLRRGSRPNNPQEFSK